MSREEQVRDILIADGILMGILEGGVFTDEQTGGVEGIRRGDESPTGTAFDAMGNLLPCALIREGNVLPYGNVRSHKDQFMAVSQVVTVAIYQFRGHEKLDLAKARIYTLLQGARLTPSFPLWLLAESAPIPDSGPLMNNMTIMQDWMIISTRIAA